MPPKNCLQNMLLPIITVNQRKAESSNLLIHIFQLSEYFKNEVLEVKAYIFRFEEFFSSFKEVTWRLLAEHSESLS